MALILAIEPDRRQASQLTAMVRGRLHAELVLAESAERALSALGERVPDLVLTSALLSPKDETALGERLRALDGQAAHVQTLTIPVLATTTKRGSSRANGMLASLRREKKKAAAPDGCDPAVFAEQCKEYLERAAAERAALLEEAANPRVKEPVRPVSPSPVTGAEWVVVREEGTVDAADTIGTASPADAEPSPQPEPVSEFEDVPPATFVRANERAPMYTPPEYRTTAFEPPADETAVETEYTAFEAPIETAAASVVLPGPVTKVEPVTRDAIEPTPADAAESSPRVDRVLREFLDLASAENEGPASLLAAVAALEAEEQSYAAAAADQPVETPVEAPAANPAPTEPEFVDLSSLLQPAANAASPTASVQPDTSADVYELDASALGSFDLVNEPAAGAEPEQLATLSDLETIFRNSPDLAAATTPAVQEPAPAKPLDALKEWDDIVEALRRDAAQLEARQPHAPNDPVASAAPAEPIALPPIEIPPFRVQPAAAEPLVQPARAEPLVQPAPADEVDAQGADNGSKKRRKRAKPSPAQDEWGFFDPDQCGFAALIEKLEEINDPDDPPTPRDA